MRRIALIALSCLLSMASSGPQDTHVALVKFADHPEEPCSVAEIEDIVYQQYAPWQLAESRGHAWTVPHPTVVVTLPHPLAYYNCVVGPAGPSVTSCDATLFQDAVQAVAPYYNALAVDLAVFVYNGGTVGAVAGAPLVHTSCPNPTVQATLSLTTMAHEGGHAYLPARVQHAGSWGCPAPGVGADLNNLFSGCGISGYDDPFDPMGAASTDLAGQHYSTHMRRRFGWMTAANTRDVAYGTSSGEIALLRADQEAPAAVQEVRALLTPGFAYSLEYRVGIGVLIRLALETPVFTAETLLIDHAPTQRALTTGQTWTDPYRHVRLDFLRIEGDAAIVKVTYVSGSGGSGGGGGGGGNPPTILPD